MSYKKKDNVALAFAANVKRIRLEARIVLDHVLNEALAEMSKEFDEGLLRGELLNIAGSPEELKEFLRRAAEKELGGRRALNK